MVLPDIGEVSMYQDGRDEFVNVKVMEGADREKYGEPGCVIENVSPMAEVFQDMKYANFPQYMKLKTSRPWYRGGTTDVLQMIDVITGGICPMKTFAPVMDEDDRQVSVLDSWTSSSPEDALIMGDRTNFVDGGGEEQASNANDDKDVSQRNVSQVGSGSNMDKSDDGNVPHDSGSDVLQGDDKDDMGLMKFMVVMNVKNDKNINSGVYGDVVPVMGCPGMMFQDVLGNDVPSMGFQEMMFQDNVDPHGGANMFPDGGANVDPDGGANMDPDGGANTNPDGGDNVNPDGGTNVSKDMVIIMFYFGGKGI